MKGKSLDEIFVEIEKCQLCSLRETRTNVVFDGIPKERPLFLVGEAPGGHEDVISGKPFSGQAGGYLTEFLDSIGLLKENCYITNMVKCRPTKESKKPRYGNYANRKPTSGEVKTCHQYFCAELDVLRPQIIVTLGGVPLGALSKEYKLGEVHGTPLEIAGYEAIVFPLYHPASVIYNQKLRSVYQDDLIKLKEFLQKHEYF